MSLWPGQSPSSSPARWVGSEQSTHRIKPVFWAMLGLAASQMPAQAAPQLLALEGSPAPSPGANIWCESTPLAIEAGAEAGIALSPRSCQTSVWGPGSSLGALNIDRQPGTMHAHTPNARERSADLTVQTPGRASRSPRTLPPRRGTALELESPESWVQGRLPGRSPVARPPPEAPAA